MFDNNLAVHGGWIETAAKVAFGLLLAVVLVLKMSEWEASLPAAPPVTPEERVAILAEARQVHDAFMGRAEWTTQDAVAARNRLVDLRHRLSPSDSAGFAQVGDLVEAVVDRALGARRAAIEAAAGGDIIARQRADWDERELLRAYDYSLPGVVGEGRERFASFAWLLGCMAVLAYLLFIPFALAIFAARLRRMQASLADELVYGWKNLLFSAVVWPFGMADYPCNTAREIRRRHIEAEYRARVGKTSWSDELTPVDRRRIEELVTAPKTELAARLAAIRDMPAAVLWQARLAAYTGMVIGFLTASVSASALAQSRPTTEASSTAEAGAEPERPMFEVRGFTQAEIGVPARPLTLARTWLIGEAHPLPEMDVRIVLDLFGTGGALTLRDAAMRIAPAGSPFSLRGGQLMNRAVFMTPAPNLQRLIGGPGAGALLSYLDLGVEVAFQDGWFGCAVEVMSGAGMNRTDDNDDKDVMASVALGPFGPLRFALALQAGNQPDGFRMRSAAHAVAVFGPVTVDLLGAHQLMAGVDSWAVSGMVAWRVHPSLDLAVGYDEMHVAGSPDDHVLRGQLTLHLVDDHVEMGAAYRWSAVDGPALLTRTQFSF